MLIVVRRWYGRAMPEVPELLEVKGPGGDRQHWLRLRIAPGWAAAYRLHNADGSVEIAELRLFPDGADGRDPIVGLGEGKAVPPGGLTSRTVRQVRLSELTDRPHLRAEVLERLGVRPPSMIDGFPELSEEPRRPGRRRRSDLFLARIANRYEALVESGSRKPIVELTSQLTNEGGSYSEATVRGFVNEARTRGLLTSAPRGRPGGRVTPKAEQLIAEDYIRRHPHKGKRQSQ